MITIFCQLGKFSEIAPSNYYRIGRMSRMTADHGMGQYFLNLLLITGIVCLFYRSFLFFRAGFLAPAIDHMAKGQLRMMPHHAGTCIPHYGTDFFPHPGLVAVDRTVAAGGFVFLKGAVAEPQPGVFLQLPAVSAESPLCAMLVTTIKGDH
jgi:hypothetical protein